MRHGCFGLGRGAVSIVKRMAEWSEQRSLRLVARLWKLLGILDIYICPKCLAFFWVEWASMLAMGESVL